MDGEIGLVALVDFGRETVPAPILRKILRDAALDEKILQAVHSGRYGPREYQALS
jgi:hypothetical protein